MFYSTCYIMRWYCDCKVGVKVVMFEAIDSNHYDVIIVFKTCQFPLLLLQGRIVPYFGI